MDHAGSPSTEFDGETCAFSVYDSENGATTPSHTFTGVISGSGGSFSDTSANLDGLTGSALVRATVETAQGIASHEFSAEIRDLGGTLAITNVQTTTIEKNRIRIRWDTPTVASGQVRYGLTAGNLDQVGQLVTAPPHNLDFHHYWVSGLAPGTEYFFQPESTDSNGNTGVGAIVSATTEEASVPAGEVLSGYVVSENHSDPGYGLFIGNYAGRQCQPRNTFMRNYVAVAFRNMRPVKIIGSSPEYRRLRQGGDVSSSSRARYRDAGWQPENIAWIHALGGYSKGRPTHYMELRKFIPNQGPDMSASGLLQAGDYSLRRNQRDYESNDWAGYMMPAAVDVAVGEMVCAVYINVDPMPNELLTYTVPSGASQASYDARRSEILAHEAAHPERGVMALNGNELAPNPDEGPRISAMWGNDGLQSWISSDGQNWSRFGGGPTENHVPYFRIIYEDGLVFGYGVQDWENQFAAHDVDGNNRVRAVWNFPQSFSATGLWIYFNHHFTNAPNGQPMTVRILQGGSVIHTATIAADLALATENRTPESPIRHFLQKKTEGRYIDFGQTKTIPAGEVIVEYTAPAGARFRIRCMWHSDKTMRDAGIATGQRDTHNLVPQYGEFSTNNGQSWAACSPFYSPPRVGNKIPMDFTLPGYPVSHHLF